MTAETRQPRLRSKRGHERRVNRAIYAALIAISVVWLIPFILLVLQSFRSYRLEKGGMVDYLLPRHFSLDNYAFLFQGSNFFPWCGRALLISAVVSAAMTAAICFAQKAMDRPDFPRKAKLLVNAICVAGGFALLTVMSVKLHDYSIRARVLIAILSFLLFLLAGLIFAQIYLKQDDLLLRTLPGYEPEDRHGNTRKLVSMVVEFFVLCLMIQMTLTPPAPSQYLKWYGNTLTIALFTSVIQTAMVLSVSYALSRLRFKGRKFIMKSVLVLGLFPGFLTMITLYFLLKQLGLTQAGAVPGLILIYCASSGMGYYISKGYFDTIPKSLDESARIDGATRFQVFLKIIMPLAKPIVIYTVLMAFMAPWGDYVFASYVAFGHQNGYNVAVGLYNWVNTNDYQNYFTRFCAGGVLVAVPITILFLSLQKYYVEGVTGGAVKG